jgi:hypothetical protein
MENTKAFGSVGVAEIHSKAARLSPHGRGNRETGSTVEMRCVVLFISEVFTPNGHLHLSTGQGT